MELIKILFVTYGIVVILIITASFGTECQNGYLFKNNSAVLYFDKKVSCK